jgi:hypothetical protein
MYRSILVSRFATFLIAAPASRRVAPRGPPPSAASFKGPFSITKCQTLISRFATFLIAVHLPAAGWLRAGRHRLPHHFVHLEREREPPQLPRRVDRRVRHLPRDAPALQSRRPTTQSNSFETLRDSIRERLLSMFGQSFCSLSDVISDERSSRLTTKIELGEVRELTESTDWFLPFHLLHLNQTAANRNVRGLGWEMSSRGRFATPADFPRHDGSPYRGLHVHRDSLGFVRRSRAILCHPVPNPN